MLIIVDGEIRAMTQEEEMQIVQEIAQMPKLEPTPEERMNEIEAALIELAAMIAGGV